MNPVKNFINTHIFTLKVKSCKEPEFIDITTKVEGFLQKSGVLNGFVVVFSKHTTAAITIQENEPLLIEDMCEMLERMAPKRLNYRHNDFAVRTVNMHQDECPNGHSHCQHITLGSSEYIPVIDGTLALGKWQSIFMVELDENAPVPNREILVQILGS